MVGLFREAEDALGISPDRFIRTTDPDHVAGRPRDDPPRPRQRRHLSRHVRGLVLPERGLPQHERPRRGRDAASTARTTPTSRCSGSPSATGSSASRPTRSAWSATTPSIPDWVAAGVPHATRCSASSARASRTSRSAARAPPGASRSRSCPTAHRRGVRTARWDPAAGTVYVWYDALINYITGAGFPGDPAAFDHWWPADLQVIGKDINRLHTIYWPAMLMSAGLPLPRRVWVHGWLLVQGERMSKSRGNFLDPNAVVSRRSARTAPATRVLREVAFDRDSEVSWDSFVRRYNADLANDYGNLLNRSLAMTSRYLGRRAPGAHRGRARRGVADDLRAVRGADRGLPAPRGARGALGLRRRRQPLRGRPAAVGPGQGREGRGRGCRVAAGGSPRRPAGGLPRHHLRGRAVHPRRGCPCRGAARHELGVRQPTATAAPRSPTLVAWGALGEGRIGEAAPLFPRLEADVEGG